MHGSALRTSADVRHSLHGAAGSRHAQPHAMMASSPDLALGSPKSACGQVQSAMQRLAAGSPKPTIHGEPILHAHGNEQRDQHVEEEKQFSRDAVIAFGGIKETSGRGIRSSARIGAQPNADDTQMKRAMSSAQRRSDQNAPGTSTTNKTSLLSFTCADIIERAKNMGVSMGTSIQAENESAILILDNEFKRSLTILKTKDNTEIVPSCVVVNRASNLYEDLNDEENMLDDDLAIDLPVEVKATRKKKQEEVV
jgi:hypothetical protein